ncbi:hypothetical protein [Kitasatospora sp. NPDC090308]
MFTREEIEIRTTVRSPAQARVRVDGEDLVEAAAGSDGLGS